MANPSARAWFEGKVRAINAASRRALEDAMEAGENITKHHIETRGTEGTGKRGRIETGKMLNSVDHSVKNTGPDSMEGRFGWLNQQPAWALYQEYGTKYIEPMYALSDAFEEVKIDYLRDMEDAVRDA